MCTLLYASQPHPDPCTATDAADSLDFRPSILPNCAVIASFSLPSCNTPPPALFGARFCLEFTMHIYIYREGSGTNVSTRYAS